MEKSSRGKIAVIASVGVAIVVLATLSVFGFFDWQSPERVDTNTERYLSADYEYIGVGRNAYHFSYTWKVVGADLPDGTDSGAGFDVVSTKRRIFGQHATAFCDEIIAYAKDSIVSNYKQEGYTVSPEQISIVIGSLSLLSN